LDIIARCIIVFIITCSCFQEEAFVVCPIVPHIKLTTCVFVASFTA